MTADQTTGVSNANDKPQLPDPSARVLTSEAILEGRREVFIAHGSELYRLRLTRSGKLILQK